MTPRHALEPSYERRGEESTRSETLYIEGDNFIFLHFFGRGNEAIFKLNHFSLSLAVQCGCIVTPTVSFGRKVFDFSICSTLVETELRNARHGN